MAWSANSIRRGSALPIVAAFVASAVVGVAQAGTLAVGPVEQVNPKASTIAVLGQTYKLGPTTSIKTQAGEPLALNLLAPDTIVAVEGAESAHGVATVTDVISLPQLDVPGATRLFVSGVVSSENSAGQIRVGRLVVDINATLTSDSQAFAVGNFVEIVGTQPNPGGLFLAQSIMPTNGIIAGGASANGIIAGGASANGIIAGGASANGIIAGGASANGIIAGGTK